jgi:predicted acylesterase/phospholipase RssA
MKTIKHLVLSGGGPIGLVEYGALKYLTANNIINLANIQSIYTTSIGSIIAFIYILNFDWTWIDDFFIKRPWEKLINFSYSAYLNIFYDKGIVNKKIIINALKPLFLAKEIPLTITLLEFYNLTSIELNMYTCNLSSFKKEKLNHVNTPNLELLDALYMSASVPVMFVPLYINNSYYLDGGIFINCPINECIFEKKCCYDEILCFTNDRRHPIDLCNNFYKENNYTHDSINYQLTQDANFFEYLIFIIKTLFNKLSIIENENLITIKNSINICLAEQLVDLKYWAYVFKTESERDYLIKLGEKQGEQFVTMLMSLNNNANGESVNANCENEDSESVNTNDESINEDKKGKLENEDENEDENENENEDEDEDEDEDENGESVNANEDVNKTNINEDNIE